MFNKFPIVKLIALIPFIFLSACSDKESPEHFAEEVIELLQENNTAGVIDLIISEEDALLFYSEMPSKKQMTPERFREQGKKQRAKTVKYINEISDYGKMNGGWDSAEIVNIDVSYKEANNNAVVSNIADIDIFVKLKEKTFEISLNDVLRSKSGWALYNEPRWRGLKHDPKYDVILGSELSLDQTTNIVLCSTEDDAQLVNNMLTSDYWTYDESKKRFTELVNENRCFSKEFALNTSFTVIKNGKYRRENNDLGYPFHVVKIDISNASSNPQWTSNRHVFAQIAKANNQE
jgi:hypothetical protein